MQLGLDVGGEGGRVIIGGWGKGREYRSGVGDEATLIGLDMVMRPKKSAISGAHKWAEVLQNPCSLEGPQTTRQNQKWLNSPLPSRGPTSGRKCYITPTSSKVPKQGDNIKSGYHTPAFSGAQKWVELVRNACILGGPQTRGQTQKWQPHPYLLEGPQLGRIATEPLHSWVSPNKGTKSKVATSPLPSEGPTGGRKCYITPAFSGVPKRGDKIKSGYLTLAFSGAHKWVEVLNNPCFLGGSQTRGQNPRCIPHPNLLWGPQVELLHNTCR